MRIITGIAKNKPIKSLEGESVRPTSSRVKEAIFSSLQFDIEGRRVLDLFAGSGQLGLESLSRGAASCVFVDKSAASVETVSSNIKSTGLGKHFRLVNTDACSYLRGCDEKYDLVFLDPPYKAGLLPEVFALLDGVCTAGAIIICEHAADTALSDRIGEDIHMYKQSRYGKTSVTFYKKGGV